MLQAYVEHVAERAALGIPPLPLSAKQTSELTDLLKNVSTGEADFLEQQECLAGNPRIYGGLVGILGKHSKFASVADKTALGK